MGLISPETIERIRTASDIVEVVGGYIPLKRAGANFVALCPFHKEKTPSFHVNPSRQIFHCFGCHKGGDVFRFVQEYEGLDFIEAVKRLAERARIPIEFDQQPGYRESRQTKETLFKIHEQIAQRWHHALINEAAGQPAREYLAKRQVPAEAVELFRLGYAPDLWDDTVNWAKSKGFDLALMEQAGLVIRKEQSDHYYDRFRGRLMFPICDEQGRVIAFSGRVISPDAQGGKYVNSPETPIFTKGKVFYGLDKSKRAILDSKCAVICEGQLDLIACYMAGVKNVVAPQGTAFTSEHARILSRYADEVILCFDSDKAGQDATTRVLDNLLDAGLAIRVAVIPPPHDPDSFIKEAGAPAFQKLVTEAAGFFDYYLERLCNENDLKTDRGRVAVLQQMAVAVKKTENQVLLDTYAQKTAMRLCVDSNAVRKEFQKIFAGKSSTNIAESSSELQPVDKDLPHLESWLLKLLFLPDLQEESIEWVVSKLQPEWLQSEKVRRIFLLRAAAHREERWTGLSQFVSEIEEDELRSLVTGLAADDRPIPEPKQQLCDLVNRLRQQHIDRQLAALTIQLQNPALPEDQKTEVLRQLVQLRLMRNVQV